MSRSWNGKTEFKRISGELSLLERDDFQRRALSLIRAIWPEALPTPSSRSFDRAGIDHVVWADGDSINLVVQCKGFDAKTTELGSSQILQCKKSIQAFAASGLSTKRYLLIHNRDGRGQSFREAVQVELNELIRSGRAEEAFLWDRQRLVNEAIDAMYCRLLQAIENKNLSIIDAYARLDLRTFNPIEEVPIRTAELIVDQHQLKQQRSSKIQAEDPVRVLSSQSKTNLSLLLGEFGFGKTTVILRSLSGQRSCILYVPASMISDSVVGTKDFLLSCINIDHIFEPFEEEDEPTLRLLARPGLEYILKDPESPLVLVLDALDESAFLVRRGSLQQLFNILQAVQVPVLLTMRTEFWHRQREEFEVSIGIQAKHGHRRHRKIRLIELLPWENSQLRLLAQRYQSTLKKAHQKRNIDNLFEMLDSGEFDRIYGDIPRRPLFLRFILDSVADYGLPGEKVSRVSLMAGWVRLKVLRDIHAPKLLGGVGRAPVISLGESSATAYETVQEAMVLAAGLMFRTHDNELELTSDCSFLELLDKSPRLQRITEPIGLILHSLLLPVVPRATAMSRTLRIRFAHRAFQEFFLAWFLKENSEQFHELLLPGSVQEWLDEIQNVETA